MSETELSVICKNCGSEVSPYVTECPYCGARLRKRAPKLERRDGALEAQRPRRRRRLLPRRPSIGPVALADRPYATLVAILGPAVLMIVQEATGGRIVGFGGILIPGIDDWWRYLTAPFVYGGVGYLFVVALALAIFSTGVERRLGTAPTAVLLLATGALSVLAAAGVANARDEFTFIVGGNGMALGMLAAWFALRRAEARGAIDQELDWIGVAVCAVVLLALPLFAPAADPVACVAGGAVGALAGLLAAVTRPSH
jgi:membrane associated rhomboid family serine protease